MASRHDKYAPDYDLQIKNYDCYLAEVLFGLSYEHVKEGETLLDIGIGTGLSSSLFQRAGVQVFGIDGSAEMLALCRSKGIAQELVEQDLLQLPWPYADDQFQHVISCGVFHFMGDLEGIFAEIARVQKTGGLLAFTTMDAAEDAPQNMNYLQREEDGLAIFAHSASYLYRLMQDHHYLKEKELVSLVGRTPFRAILARKTIA